MNASKVFPGAARLPPPKGHPGFTVADGKRIPHGGFVKTHVRTAEGKDKIINWKHADVAVQILSTHELARNGHKLEYDEDEGTITNKTTGEVTKFVQRNGVYFLQLFVKRDLVGNSIMDLGRQG